MPASNVFFFSWEEKFLVQQEIKKWKTSFIQKYWADSIYVYNQDNFDAGEILSRIFSGSLFSSKKLIFIYWMPKDTDWDNKLSESHIKSFEEKILPVIEKIPQDTVLVFVSYKPDKRTSWFKTLSTKTQSKSFAPLKDKQLLEYIVQKVPHLEPTIAQEILSHVWSDLSTLENELNKIKHYLARGHKLTPQSIKMICHSTVEQDNFELLDTILTDTNKSLEILQNIQIQTQDIFPVIWMLLWGVRVDISMLVLYESWITSYNDIASKLSVHPFVAAKNLKNIKIFKQKKELLDKLYLKVIDIDSGIKTWRIPQDLAWLEIKTFLIKEA